MAKVKKRSKKINKASAAILVLLLITAAAVGITIWALFFRNPAPELTPDFAPQEVEEYAEPAEDDSGEKMEVSEGGGAVSMTYQKTVEISLEDQQAKLLFQNPSRSVNDIVLQIIIVGEDGTETVIAQSGTLEPGYKVEKLDLIQDAAKLSQGTYTGKFKVMYYDPDTGERAVLTSSIEDVEITVNN